MISINLLGSRLHIHHHVIDSLSHHYETIILVELPKFLPRFSVKGVYTQELKKKKKTLSPEFKKNALG